MLKALLFFYVSLIAKDRARHTDTVETRHYFNTKTYDTVGKYRVWHSKGADGVNGIWISEIKKPQ